MKRVKKERDELKEAVRNFETELTQIQLDTKMLAEDRDNFKLLYEQVKCLNLVHIQQLLMTLVENFKLYHIVF